MTREEMIGEVTENLSHLDEEELQEVLMECRSFIEAKSLPAPSEEEAIEMMARHIDDRINSLGNPNDILPNEYHYSCLPLCLLDAIYSIGVRYSSTKNVVKRYCKKVGISEFADVANKPETHKIEDLLEAINNDPEKFAKEIVENQQRTSSKNGILKAQAVFECAKKLSDAEIQTISDFQDKCNEGVESEFKVVKGQTSGISFSYLKMLCGGKDGIKPDRHVLRFLARYLGYEPDKEDAERIIRNVVTVLDAREHEDITPREVDYLIWSEMRER